MYRNERERERARKKKREVQGWALDFRCVEV